MFHSCFYSPDSIWNYCFWAHGCTLPQPHHPDTTTDRLQRAELKFDPKEEFRSWRTSSGAGAETLSFRNSKTTVRSRCTVYTATARKMTKSNQILLRGNVSHNNEPSGLLQRWCWNKTITFTHKPETARVKLSKNKPQSGEQHKSAVLHITKGKKTFLKFTGMLLHLNFSKLLPIKPHYEIIRS